MWKLLKRCQPGCASLTLDVSPCSAFPSCLAEHRTDVSSHKAPQCPLDPDIHIQLYFESFPPNFQVLFGLLNFLRVLIENKRLDAAKSRFHRSTSTAFDRTTVRTSNSQVFKYYICESISYQFISCLSEKILLQLWGACGEASAPKLRSLAASSGFLGIPSSPWQHRN